MPSFKRVAHLPLLSICCTALALGLVSCQDAEPPADDKVEPEPWEQFLAEDSRFNDELTGEDVDSLCESTNTALNDFNDSDNLDVDFDWDGGNFGCGGSVAISTESKSVIITGYLSFEPLNSGQQKELADQLIDQDGDVGECSLTDILVSGVSEPHEHQTTNGGYCGYVEGEDPSYSAYALGAFVAGKSTVSANFSATDDEADSDQVQQGVEKALETTMEALRKEQPGS